MKRRLLEELPLIGASLVIACVLWLIAKQGDLDSNWLNIPVQIVNVPPGMQVEGIQGEISIKAQFPAEQRNDVLSKNFRLEIDAPTVFDPNPKNWSNPSEPLTQERKIDASMINRIGLDPAVEVIEIDPPVISLRGRFIIQNVTIEVPTVGELPSNKQFTQPPRPDPAEIKVTGSPEALERLAASDYKIKTTSITLSALQGSTQLLPNLVLPEGVTPIDYKNNFVTVNIGLIEKSERRTLAGIPVIVIAFDPTLVWNAEPRTVDVVLEGPPSALNAVTVDDVMVGPTKRLSENIRESQDVAIEARLKDSIPSDIVRQISIIECRPSRITVEFKPATVQNNGELPSTVTK